MVFITSERESTVGYSTDTCCCVVKETISAMVWKQYSIICHFGYFQVWNSGLRVIARRVSPTFSLTACFGFMLSSRMMSRSIGLVMPSVFSRWSMRFSTLQRKDQQSQLAHGGKGHLHVMYSIAIQDVSHELFRFSQRRLLTARHCHDREYVGVYFTSVLATPPERLSEQKDRQAKSAVKGNQKTKVAVMSVSRGIRVQHSIG